VTSHKLQDKYTLGHAVNMFNPCEINMQVVEETWLPKYGYERVCQIDIAHRSYSVSVYVGNYQVVVRVAINKQVVSHSQTIHSVSF